MSIASNGHSQNCRSWMTFTKDASSNQMVQPFVQRTFCWEKTILARFILFSRIVLFKPRGTNLGGKDDS